MKLDVCYDKSNTVSVTTVNIETPLSDIAIWCGGVLKQGNAPNEEILYLNDKEVPWYSYIVQNKQGNFEVFDYDTFHSRFAEL